MAGEVESDWMVSLLVEEERDRLDGLAAGWEPLVHLGLNASKLKLPAAALPLTWMMTYPIQILESIESISAPFDAR